MLPILFELGPIKISTFGFFAAVIFFAASFILWRSLKEDYQEEEILTFTLYLFIGAILGARIVYILSNFSAFGFSVSSWLLWTRYPGFSLLGAILGGGVLLYYWSKRKQWDLWLVGDKLIFVFLSAQILGSLGGYLSTASFFYLVMLILSTFILGVCWLMNQHYRKFLWYKSGKVGFVACVGFFFFFLGLSLLEILTKSGIYFEKLVYPLLSAITIGLLCKRSERNWRVDLGTIFRRKR